MAANARRVALSVLETLDRSDQTLDALLSRALEKRPDMKTRDRALTTALVFGVVRWQGRLDWVIRQTSHLSFSKISRDILQILRLGLYQVLFLSKVPEAVAVDESVELAKIRAPKWVAGYVNGVLRAALRRKNDFTSSDATLDTISALSIEESHPGWLVKRWVKRIGLAETRRLCQANNRIPPVTIRVNSLKTTREDVKDALTPAVREIRKTPYAPDGLTLIGIKEPIGRMPTFHHGFFQVQDEAAQLVSLLLDPQNGESVLDSCAGFGGKTGHIAQLMKNTGQITAVDDHQGKLEALRKAMVRQEISSVKIWARDVLISFPQRLFRSFDRVLLDAPCSGLGVIRRNPDVKWRMMPKRLPALIDRQKGLLHSVAPLVKNEGILVYSVCSMEPEEGEGVVESFLKTHDDFVIDETPVAFFDQRETFLDRPGVFKSLPHKHDTDGFFAVRLRRVNEG